VKARWDIEPVTSDLQGDLHDSTTGAHREVILDSISEHVFTVDLE